MQTLPLLCFALLSLALGFPERASLGQRYFAPQGWMISAPAPDQERLHFVVALPQRNLDELERRFWERSDPDSPLYQEWMGIDDILALVAPPKDLHDRVAGWLKSEGILVRSLGDALQCTCTVETAKRVFHAEFRYYKNIKTGGAIISLFGDHSIPMAIRSDIEFIEGLATFPAPHLNAHSQSANDDQRRGLWDWDTYIVPQTVYNLYQVPSNYDIAANVSQAVIEWEGQSYDNLDLQTFAKQMLVNNVNIPTPAHVVGPNDPSSAGLESTLDIQWISATGVGGTNWFWLNGGSAWLYGWATSFFSTSTIPYVNSISYGWNEEDQCEMGIGGAECNQLGVNSTAYVARVNVEFQKIGLRGITLVAASGDSGANGRTDPDCTENHFNPAFPAASPFLVAVGATQLRDCSYGITPFPPVCSFIENEWWCASGGTEQAVSYGFAGFASGGGFSNVASMPSFQKSFVDAYFKTSQGQSAPTGYFNRQGRAFPDIAALGAQILIELGGAQSVGGTSCSSPIVAGIFSLLNDYSIGKKGASIGPMTQFLYKMATALPGSFTDVTVGDNICTEDGCGSSCKGFLTAPGWDPVTGLGTPIYPNMLKYLKSVIG